MIKQNYWDETLFTERASLAIRGSKMTRLSYFQLTFSSIVQNILCEYVKLNHFVLNLGVDLPKSPGGPPQVFEGVQPKFRRGSLTVFSRGSLLYFGGGPPSFFRGSPKIFEWIIYKFLKGFT